MKKVILTLVQTNKAGKTNATVSFQATTEEGTTVNDKVVSFLVDKLFGVFEIQSSIAEKGGKNRLFNITKSGDWSVSIDVETTEGEELNKINLLAGLKFSFDELGKETDNEGKKAILNEIVSAWYLLNTVGTI